MPFSENNERLSKCVQEFKAQSTCSQLCVYTHLLLGLPGQRGVVLQKCGQGEICGGQLPVYTVPHCRVAVSACQRLHGTQVVVYGLQLNQKKQMYHFKAFLGSGQNLESWEKKEITQVAKEQIIFRCLSMNAQCRCCKQVGTAPCCSRGLLQARTRLWFGLQRWHSGPERRFSLTCPYYTTARLCLCCLRWLQSPSCLSQRRQNSFSTSPALLWTPTSSLEGKRGQFDTAVWTKKLCKHSEATHFYDFHLLYFC